MIEERCPACRKYIAWAPRSGKKGEDRQCFAASVHDCAMEQLELQRGLVRKLKTELELARHNLDATRVTLRISEDDLAAVRRELVRARR